MCVYVRVCVRACVCVCVCGGGRFPGAKADACTCACVALLTQRATPMRHIVTSFVAPLAEPYFSILSHKRRDFRKKVIEYKMCVLIFSTTFIRNVSHST